MGGSAKGDGTVTPSATPTPPECVLSFTGAIIPTMDVTLIAEPTTFTLLGFGSFDLISDYLTGRG